MDQTENTQKIVITKEDVQSAMEFWKHFNIPVKPELKQAFDRFCENPTFENQEAIKFFVTTDISTNEHPAFKDEMFDKIREECEKVSYEMAFSRDLENVLVVEEKTEG